MLECLVVFCQQHLDLFNSFHGNSPFNDWGLPELSMLKRLVVSIQQFFDLLNGLHIDVSFLPGIFLRGLFFFLAL